MVLREARIIVILFFTFTQTLKYYEDRMWTILASHTSADFPKILKQVNLRDTRYKVIPTNRSKKNSPQKFP